MGELVVRVRAAVVGCGVEVPELRVEISGGLFEEQVGVVAPSAVEEVWSVLGGVDAVGCRFLTEFQAGYAVAARAGEAESMGFGQPYAMLDGSAGGAVRMVWWDRRWFPLAMDAQCSFAVDGNPGVGGRVGQVLWCSFDYSAEREALWPDVVSLLRDVLWVLESSALVVDDGFGVVEDERGSQWPWWMAVVQLARARRGGEVLVFPGLRGR